MKYILSIILLLLFSFNQYNKPNTGGINHYVLENKDYVVKQVEEFIKDTIYYYNIKTDNLSLYTDADTLELGRYYYPDYIIITNEEKFQGYELDFMPKWKQRISGHSNKFVKAVLIHEIAHIYFNQVVNLRQYNKQYVDIRYEPQRVYGKKNNNDWNASFIEEGVCEYIIQKMGEALYDDDFDVKPTEIMTKPNNHLVKYRYSVKFLRPFLDSCYNADGDLNHALNLIVGTAPPSVEEIIYEDLYFSRLK